MAHVVSSTFRSAGSCRVAKVASPDSDASGTVALITKLADLHLLTATSSPGRAVRLHDLQRDALRYDPCTLADHHHGVLRSLGVNLDSDVADEDLVLVWLGKTFSHPHEAPAPLVRQYVQKNLSWHLRDLAKCYVQMLRRAVPQLDGSDTVKSLELKRVVMWFVTGIGMCGHWLVFQCFQT